MDSLDAAAEVAKLKLHTRTIRKTRYSKSRLDRYRGELITLHQEGATIAELQRWLRAKRIKTAYSTVHRWVSKNA